MMNVRYLVVLVFSQTFLALAAPRAGCSISVNNDLSDPQPLVIDPTEDMFLLPTSGDRIQLDDGDLVQLACPGSSNYLIIDGSSGDSVATAMCKGGKFTLDDQSVYFDMITCKSNPYHVAKRTDRECFEGNTVFEIGFEVDVDRFLTLMEICFDEDLQSTVYSRFDLTQRIDGYQSGYPRPGWMDDQFEISNVDNLYSRNTQRKTINALLGLPENSYKYISKSDDYFLSRGHLTAKADFVYGAHQRATFYFLNAAPQWQTFNGRNWNVLEGDLRSYASVQHKDLIVYTGIHGVAKLPHEETSEQIGLYLYVDGDKKQIPVPALYWKVAYDPKTKAGIAFVGVNNPYHEELDEEVRVCEDLCEKISWLNWNQEDVVDGYTYCCAVDDLRKVVTSVPEMEIEELLV